MFEAAALFVASHFVFLSRLSVLSQRLSASQFSHSITALILSQKQVEKKSGSFKYSCDLQKVIPWTNKSLILDDCERA